MPQHFFFSFRLTQVTLRKKFSSSSIPDLHHCVTYILCYSDEDDDDSDVILPHYFGFFCSFSMNGQSNIYVYVNLKNKYTIT